MKYIPEIKNFNRLFKIVAFLFVTVVLVRNTWVGDDAFITMRVVDNFFNGYGLVWNVGERVQVFTSPLWMLLSILGYGVIRDPYITLYVLSLVISLASFFLVLYFFCKNAWLTLLITLLVVGSVAYIDYSSSGLENPLTHLLLIVTLIVVFRLQLPPVKILFFASLLACLAALTRLDTLLFYLPFLSYQLYKQRRDVRAYLVTALAFLPLLVWFVGATFYYGFPLPNTFYAKLPSNYPLSYFVEHGIDYYLNSLDWDPLTLLTIFTGMLLVGLTREPLKISFAVGVGLYLLYGLRIGGDFMSGRFLSAAFIVIMILLTLIDYEKIFGGRVRYVYSFAVLLVMVLGISADSPPVLLPENAGESQVVRGIADEKLFYLREMGMLNRFKNNETPKFGLGGLKIKKRGKSPVMRPNVGVFGFYAGPSIYIIDENALADPLRARLPAHSDARIGHFARPVPAGFKRSVSGDFKNQLEDPQLKAYYDKLLVLMRGPLFAPRRVSEIIAFNLGQYDGLLKAAVVELK